MGVAQPERIDVVFLRSSRQQNLRTGKIYTLHKQKQFGGYTMHVISHHKYGVYTHYNYKHLTFLGASH